MIIQALIMFLPFIIGFLVLFIMEHEPERKDLPPKEYPDEPIADRIYRRDIVPRYKLAAEATKLYLTLRIKQVQTRYKKEKLIGHPPSRLP